jgi:16S rRNA processing protein RimM
MSDADREKKHRVLLGEIAGVHGIRGDVLIRTYTADPKNIAGYGPLENESGAQTFSVTVVRSTDKGVVAKIAAISDRTRAEALRGTKLYVAREKLPQLDEAEFYHADLIGLAAVDTEGVLIGKVIGVENFGAGDLLELQLAGKSATELILFSDAFVPNVDLARGVVTIVMPEFVSGEKDHGEPGETGQS